MRRFISNILLLLAVVILIACKNSVKSGPFQRILRQSLLTMDSFVRHEHLLMISCMGGLDHDEQCNLLDSLTLDLNNRAEQDRIRIHSLLREKAVDPYMVERLAFIQ